MGLATIKHVSDHFENWFIDYASYVILERAVPMINDGLKPVQRRILHALNEMDDGRFNKVANVIGSTMQYHPHGDQSIQNAIVHLGQKDYLIETQGNWGDVRTGDRAAAPRYIEARLSKLAKDIMFNDETTNWQVSYDGRKREPMCFPVKFPILLAHGTEGIAVGLNTKLLPHNFHEIIDAAIAYLRGESFLLLPDFQTGGLVDIRQYKDGERGGKVRVRASIEVGDKKNLVIKNVPYGITTESLMESIVKANDTGKIKIKKVTDNTAKDVEIWIELLPGTSPDVTIDALYAFTNCEVSISPNACVIVNNKPLFLTISELLKQSVEQTRNLLKRELELKLNHLLERWHFSSLEKIFIEEKIYREIEETESWEEALATIDRRLQPFKKLFKRDITKEDIAKLPEIPIRRIGKFDKKKADELLMNLENDMDEVNKNLGQLTRYTIKFYEQLKNKHGKGRERKTEIRAFDVIKSSEVVALNQKLYINRVEGFVGFGIKKDEFICECSDMDDIIAFTKEGTMKVVKVSEKTFVGKDIIYANVFKKNDERTTYNIVYLDGETGTSFTKRFNVTGITRDKSYTLTKGSKGSKIVHFTANANGEAEKISVFLSSSCKAKIKQFDFDFTELTVKTRSSIGNQLTKYPIRKTSIKELGNSTLGGIEVYLDEAIGRLNTDRRGTLLGEFNAEDLIVVFFADGTFEFTNFDITNRYDIPKIVRIEQYEAEKIYTLVHYDAGQEVYLVKRFRLDALPILKLYKLISEASNSKLIHLLTDAAPVLSLELSKGKSNTPETIKIQLTEIIDVKSWKAMGNRLSQHTIKKITNITPAARIDNDPPTLF